MLKKCCVTVVKASLILILETEGIRRKTLGPAAMYHNRLSPRNGRTHPADSFLAKVPRPPGATRLIACNASNEFVRRGQAQHFGLCLRTHIESKAENSTTHLEHLAHTGRWLSVDHAPRLQPYSEEELKRINDQKVVGRLSFRITAVTHPRG